MVLVMRRVAVVSAGCTMASLTWAVLAGQTGLTAALLATTVMSAIWGGVTAVWLSHDAGLLLRIVELHERRVKLGQ
jgi:hypothetical protein